MLVRVCYDNGHDGGDFEYFSKYNRINARGIKDEMSIEMCKRYGASAKYYEVTCFYRVDQLKLYRKKERKIYGKSCGNYNKRKL